MLDIITQVDNCPSFDWVILGMGEDGHTASLFIVNEYFYTQKLTCVTVHPQSGQKRISLSQKTLCASKNITFMVTGKDKSAMIKKIVGKEKSAENYPASHIRSKFGKTIWLLDKEAGRLI